MFVAIYEHPLILQLMPCKAGKGQSKISLYHEMDNFVSIFHGPDWKARWAISGPQAIVCPCRTHICLTKVWTNT